MTDLPGTAAPRPWPLGFRVARGLAMALGTALPLWLAGPTRAPLPPEVPTPPHPESSRELGPPGPPAPPGADPEVAPPGIRDALSPPGTPPGRSSGLTHGLDVSHYQGPIRWDVVYDGGFRFTYIKCSQGTRYRDPTFASHWRDSGAAGFARGAYHFFDPRSDPAAQAANLVGCLGDRRGELPPAIDIERYSDAYEGMRCDPLIADLRQLIEAVQRATGQRPVIYTDPMTWRDQLCGTDALDGYPLWLASYTPEVHLPPGWSHWTLWQRAPAPLRGASSATVDQDVFHGSLEALLRLGE